MFFLLVFPMVISIDIVFGSLFPHSLCQNGFSGLCVIPLSITSSTNSHGYLSPSILYDVISESPRYVSYFWFMLPYDRISSDFLIAHVGYSVVLRFSVCAWRFELPYMCITMSPNNQSWDISFSKPTCMRFGTCTFWTRAYTYVHILTQ